MEDELNILKYYQELVSKHFEFFEEKLKKFYLIQNE